MKTLSHELKIARLNKQVSQKQAASDIGITPSYLCQLETNNITTTFQTLDKICMYYQIDIQKMLLLMTKNETANKRANTKYKWRTE